SRLRAVRKQMRLSLQAVEAMSDQEFKASVLGAYERGHRAISVPRLQRLARLYDVPVEQLLPEQPDGQPIVARHSGGQSRNAPHTEKIRISVARLKDTVGPEAEAIQRY